MKIQLASNENATRLAKRMMFLAYEACGGPMGMGFLQARSNVTEEQVWNNVVNNGDYPGGPVNRGGRIYGDYVFGRMMKFGVEIVDNTVSFRTDDLRPDYHAFSGTYRNGEKLAKAALSSLNLTVEAVITP
jgi:hypothetical protein